MAPIFGFEKRGVEKRGAVLTDTENVAQENVATIGHGKDGENVATFKPKTWRQTGKTAFVCLSQNADVILH